MPDRLYRAVLLGGSAGCGPVLDSILSFLPRDFSIPLVILRHTGSEEKGSEYSSVLSEKYGLTVKEPEDKEKMEDSTVYVSPPGYHLLVEEDGTFALNTYEKEEYCRPSIDVLFSSAARSLRDSVVAVILSGANSDGAAGLAGIAQKGGVAIVQDPSTAAYPHMPQAAIERCGADRILTPREIVDFICGINKNNRRSIK